MKESAQNFGNKAKEFANTRGKTFAREVNETARSGGRGLGHAIGVLFKVFFLFIAGTIAFGLFVAVMALIFGGIAWWPVNNFLWTSKWQQVYAWGTLDILFRSSPDRIYHLVDPSDHRCSFPQQLSRLDICFSLDDWLGCRHSVCHHVSAKIFVNMNIATIV